MTIDTTDLRAECTELELFMFGLSPEDWRRRTAFYGWTVADEVMHLCQVDRFGQLALDTPEASPDLVSWVRAGAGCGYWTQPSGTARAARATKSSCGCDWWHNAPPSIVSMVPVTYFDSSEAR